MKKAILLPLLVIVVSTINAQFVIQKDSLPKIIKLKPVVFDSSFIINRTHQGIIYALPMDRMPVLKPDTFFRSNMPVIVTDKNFTSRMPVYVPNPAFVFTQPSAVPGNNIFFVPQRKQSNPLLKPQQKETLRFETPGGSRGIYIF